MNKKDKQNALLPFSVIVAATSGNIEAINAVLKFYEGYIAVLSTRQYYDDKGNSHWFVDEEMRRRLETKLITRIILFKSA